MEYLLHVAVLMSLYIALAAALDLLVGRTGILSVAHAGFFGIGAYTSALLVTKISLAWPTAFLCAALAGMILSFLVAVPALRLKGDYFVLVTFAFQMVAFSVLNNWVVFTGGPMGIPAIPTINILGFSLDARWKVLFLALAFSGTVFLFLDRLRLSPFGRLLHSIREDESLAQSCGRSTGVAKLKVFAISAGVAAAAGAIYAHYIGYIDPSSFTVMESILVLAMVIIGGADSRWGPLAGAIALVALPELLRFVGLPDDVAAKLRELIYGAVLTVIVVARSQVRCT
ncbi:MAG: branched-chain amino acid ABC transporter permease [Pseudomonadota bacterium]|nr:branched-chain amino acid ABC transporter permease [Pseudomonadota bacterium]